MDGIIKPNSEDQKPDHLDTDLPKQNVNSLDNGLSTPDLNSVTEGVDSEQSNSEPPINEEVELPELESEAEREIDEAVTAGVVAIGGLALKFHHLKQFFKNWWSNKKWRYGTLGSLMLLFISIGVYPTTRFGVLNLLGFDGKVDITLRDIESNMPVVGAKVTIGGAEGYTGMDGRGIINDVSLGRQELIVTKPGYGDYSNQVVVSLGGNRFENIAMNITGVKLIYHVVDFLSGQPIKSVLAEINSLGSSAVAGEDGIITLAAPFAEGSMTVEFKVDKYRNEQIKATVENNGNQQEVKMVLSGKHAFMSKRDGQFDLFSSDLDGTNKIKILAATGKERQSTLSLLPNPLANRVALVSTRDGQLNEDGFVLSGLYIVDLTTSDSIRVDFAESIQLIGWSDNVLVYQTQVAGESGYSENRYQIKRFVVGNLTGEKLIGSNYFSDTMLAGGRVFYAPSQSFKQNNPEEFFYSMNPDGSDIKTHIRQTTWQIARTSFEKLVIETVEESVEYKRSWYEFDLNMLSEHKLDSQPANFEYWNNNGEFIDSQDGSKIAWIDNRDGQTVIIVKDKNGSEKLLLKMAGIKAPVRWVGNELIIFRVSRPGEVADYIISVSGDKAIKLDDVTDISSSWTSGPYY